MLYRKKFIITVSIIAVLALTYILSFVFDPARTRTGTSMYTWLDSGQLSGATRIVFGTAGETYMEFVNRDNLWFVLRNEKEYPVRHVRMDDFLAILTERSAWPVRYTNTASHTRLGLETATASRVTIYGENNSVLLDMLIGLEDILIGDIFLRRVGQNEVRSGNALIATYVFDMMSRWLNLRLIHETLDERISVETVQRLSVNRLDEMQVFTRRNRDWVISGFEVEDPDQNAVEAFVRTILNLEGEDFVDDILPNDPVFGYSRFILELGTGQTIIIRISDFYEDTGRRLANIGGSEYVYLLPQWSSQWIFRTSGDFETR